MTETTTPELALISGVDFFRPLSQESLATVARATVPMRLESGDVLIHQGEQGDDMFVVESGTLHALVRRHAGEMHEVGLIGPGQPVGEIQFLGGGSRVATVRAKGPCVVHRLPRTVFNDLPADALSALSSSPLVRRRLHKTELSLVLPAVFGPLEPAVMDEIEQQIEWVDLDRGQALFQQGDACDGWYLVLNGRIRILVTDPVTGKETAVGELGRGESLGEIAMITGEGRTAAPYAIRDSLLARFPVKAFEEIMDKHPRVLLSICRTLLQRSKNAQKRSGALSRLIIAVAPARDQTVAAGFAAGLTRALSGIGTTLHVSAQTLIQEHVLDRVEDLPVQHPNWLRFSAWMEEQQSRYNFIVLETDATVTPWTQRALGQADHVVVVADAASDPAPGEIEARFLLDDSTGLRRSRRTLVLVHDEATLLPSGTRRWLDPRRVDAHLHIRADRQGDLERVARTLTGRAVGLTLGGGGARGYAHFGVVKALGELGIPIDVIGGTSMGSIMAGQLATGRTLEQLFELNRKIIALKPFSEYTVPMIAMLRTKRIEDAAKMSFGDTLIEDLWLPYFAVSSNLTTAEMVVHETGSVWEATRASGSLPGIAVPVISGSHLLVDGGLINNLPGDVMRRKCGGGPVIAVNVSPQEDVGVGADGFPSPWKVFWHRVLPFRRNLDVSSVLDILLRTPMLASANRTEAVKRSVDLYLGPPIDDFGMLEFEKMADLVEIGYAYTMATAAGWTPPK